LEIFQLSAGRRAGVLAAQMPVIESEELCSDSTTLWISRYADIKGPLTL
jgi:hypothetical protein